MALASVLAGTSCAILALGAVAGSKSLGADMHLATKDPAYMGNRTCRSCHREIYESYSRTAMGQTSGPAFSSLIEGTYRHERSGVEYRVYAEGERAYLAYERPGDPGMRGRQELEDFVGSNTRGRTFLFRIEGLLYQSPINYYAEKKGWDMSPGYQSLQEMELNHPVPPSCLFCHASRVQVPTPGAPNRYAGAPFLQPGVGCERCHGPGEDHVSGRGALVNPANLRGERRDSVCVQCHLEGQARVDRPGRTLEMYRPGDVLSDDVSTFVYEDSAKGALGAVSQVEALARSRCYQRSGDRMSCIVCHDPHTPTPPERRVAYYRDKCLLCHQPSFAERHQGGSPDCIGCHMPRGNSADIRHTEVTDHRIRRRPGQPDSGLPALPQPRLVPFGTTRNEPRDLGLAYAEVALRGNAYASQEALRLLQLAVTRYPEDEEVLARLGFLYQQLGQAGRAQQMYERALKVDPEKAVAASNLGVIYASRGNLRTALPLWDRVFAENPGLSEVGLNLTIALCREGDAARARQVVVEVLRHNPDMGRAHTILQGLENAGACGSAKPAPAGSRQP
jgi:hypothetical protein